MYMYLQCFFQFERKLMANEISTIAMSKKSFSLSNNDKEGSLISVVGNHRRKLFDK